MTRRRKLTFAAFLGVLLLVPLALIGWNEFRLASGEKVILHVQPVDPDDPFRGEYVALSYDISNVPVERGTESGDTVYVVLHRQGRAWRGRRAVRERPGSGTFIRGRVSRGRIEYGIETFYVEEGKSPEYERAISRQELYAEVVLDDEGGAKLEDLIIRPLRPGES